MGDLAWGGWAYVGLLAVGLAACNAGKSCPQPGRTQPCACDAAQGERRCLPERVWSSCACNAGLGSDGGPSPATEAGTRDGAAASSTPSTTPDAASTKPSTSTDSGSHAASDAGRDAATAGRGAAGTGGASDAGPGGRGPDASSAGGGGAGGTSGGTAGASGASADAYAACSSASACTPAGSNCLLVPADATFGTPGGSACAPHCTSVSDCPVPAGSYEASLSCDADQLCRLDCTDNSGNFPPMPRSCPAGMTCMMADLASSYCLR